MIEFINLMNAHELDAFVKQHEKCHFMQTSLWGRVKSDWHWYGIIYRDANRSIRGTMALLSRKLKWPGSCMLYAPRGPIFDHGDVHTLQKLIEAAKQLAYRLDAVVLRIDPMIDEKDAKYAEVLQSQEFECDRATDYSLFQPRMCYVLDLEGIEAESLESYYHRSARIHLHKARRQEIRVSQSEDVGAFYALMQKTAQHNGFVLRKEDYFRRFLQQLGSHAQLYLAYRDSEAIAGSIAVFYGNRAWYMYGASDPENRKAHPNELLQWQMQQDAIKRNCRCFDLRGVEGYPIEGNPKLGLHQFKQGFSAKFTAYLGQLDYVCRPFVWYLMRLYGSVK